MAMKSDYWTEEQITGCSMNLTRIRLIFFFDVTGNTYFCK